MKILKKSRVAIGTVLATSLLVTSLFSVNVFGVTSAKSGVQKETIVVKAGETFDGKGQKFWADKSKLGDGSQKEGQKPIFKLEKGAKLKNVILSAPAADGVHCYGDNLVENVVWEDIGEDALTVKGGGTVEVKGGSAKKGDDKCFQVNSSCTFKVTNFTADTIGKLVRQNGGTTFKLTVYLENVTVKNASDCVVRSDSSSCNVYYRNLTTSNVKTLWKLKTTPKKF